MNFFLRGHKTETILVLSEEETQSLRKIELELLQDFVSVCGQLNLRYFMVQGTLLGAVRHGGFIPWDDDIDVGMLREDYEVFLAHAQSLLPKEVFLQTHETDPEYMHCFAKLRRDGTIFMEQTQQGRNIHHGIYLDVFPFDYYPDNSICAMIYDLKKLLIRYRIRTVYYIPSDNTWTPVNLFRRLLKIIARLIYSTPEKAFDAQERLYASATKGKRRINNGSPWGKRECVPSAWLDSTVPLVFEGHTLLGPKAYDKYLRHAYGEYMTLPPESERVPHHHLCYFEAVRPFAEE